MPCALSGEPHRVLGEVSDELPLLWIGGVGDRSEKTSTPDFDNADDRDAAVLVEHDPGVRTYVSLDLGEGGPVLNHGVSVCGASDSD